jgi:hypothetical protein
MFSITVRSIPGPGAVQHCGNEGQYVGAAEAGDIIAELSGAKLSVVGDVVAQAALIEAALNLFAVSRAASGVICMSPIALVPETTRGLNALSWRTIE